MSVKVLTSDNVILEINKSIMHFFKTLQNMVEDIGDIGDMHVPLPNIASHQLQIMIEWATHHVEVGTVMPVKEYEQTVDENGVKYFAFKKSVVCESYHMTDQWNVDFARKLGYATISSLFPATNYIEFYQFYEFLCQSVVMILKEDIEEKCYKPVDSNMSLRECDERMRGMFNRFDPALFVDDMTDEQKTKLLSETVWCYDRSDFAPKAGYDGKFV